MTKVLPQDDSRPIDELVNIALGDPDENAAWDAVCALHWRGTEEVLQTAQELCRSSYSLERELGCDILGQVGVPERTFPNECAATLLETLRRETEAKVQRSIFVAFSHLGDEQGATAAIEYAGHSDPDVRHAVVLALSSCDTEGTIATLLDLSKDSDPHIRDWATFSLGKQTQVDSPAIRDALAARLSDVDADTRGEALVGLANRGDVRAVTAIAEDEDSFAETDCLVEARFILEEKRLI